MPIYIELKDGRTLLNDPEVAHNFDNVNEIVEFLEETDGYDLTYERRSGYLGRIRITKANVARISVVFTDTPKEET